MFAFAVLVLFVTACASNQHQLLNRPTPSPINSIRVGTFQCADEVMGLAVRNVFLEVLGNSGDVKVVQEGDADVVIQGTVTLLRGGSSSGSAGANANFALAENKSSGGDYVSGVTSLALRNGDIITSASFGQSLNKGGRLFPPELVAREAANRLVDQLVCQGMIPLTSRRKHSLRD
jgi:hypothetical protein